MVASSAESSARLHAERADEKWQRKEKLGSLKIRAYQKTRSAMLNTVLPQLSRDAEKAGERGVNQLSTVEQQLAENARKLVELAGTQSADASGPPDWPGIASDLRGWTTNQPIEFRAFMGAAFVMLNQSDFALAEFESVDVAHLRSTNSLRIYHGGRALLYAMQGWNHLAAVEAEAFTNTVEFAEAPVTGRQLVACLHGLLAIEAADQRDFVKMDAEIAQSFRVWPDNPVAVFLTGERLAANGEWEKAAGSLETLAAGTEDEWLVRRFAQRAREFRDGKGSTKALVFDSRFLFQMGAHMTVKAAKSSTVGQRSAEFLDEASVFGKDLLKKVPFISGGALPSPQQSNEATVIEAEVK